VVGALLGVAPAAGARGRSAGQQPQAVLAPEPRTLAAPLGHHTAASVVPRIAAFAEELRRALVDRWVSCPGPGDRLPGPRLGGAEEAMQGLFGSAGFDPETDRAQRQPERQEEEREDANLTG
jgi:hypothetical protein